MDLTQELIDSESIVPLYKQLVQFLNSAIESRQFKPGDRIPSENELIKTFKVSRVTVRRAIQELAYQEKIISVPGKGCFVTQPKIEPLSALTSFSENMRAQGYEPSYKDTVVTYISPTKNIQSHLMVSEKERVLYIHRMMLADGMPMAISNIYLPERVYKRNPSLFIPEVLNQISLYKIIELELGLTLFRADEWVDATKATQEEASLLNIKKDDLLLIIDRVTYSSSDQYPIEYVRQLYTANKYRYKVELFRSQKQRQAYERR
jgi:GntR family transcriptional regulator